MSINECVLHLIPTPSKSISELWSVRMLHAHSNGKKVANIILQKFWCFSYMLNQSFAPLEGLQAMGWGYCHGSKRKVGGIPTFMPSFVEIGIILNFNQHNKPLFNYLYKGNQFPKHELTMINIRDNSLHMTVQLLVCSNLVFILLCHFMHIIINLHTVIYFTTKRNMKFILA